MAFRRIYAAVVAASATVALLAGDVARAESGTEEDEAERRQPRLARADAAGAARNGNDGSGMKPAEHDIAPRIPPSRPPRRKRKPDTADPWFTRGTVSFTGATDATLDARIPVAGMTSRYRGRSSAGALGIDMYGRWLGFHLQLGGGYTDRVNAPVDGLTGSSLSAGSGRASITGVIWNARGVFVAVGPSIEGRANAIGSLELGNAALASWQTAVAGGELRSRVFVGPRLYVTTSAFAGLVPVGGGWQSMDAAAAVESAGTDLTRSGSLERATVLGGTLALSLRPLEGIALTGGIDYRTATYGFSAGGTGAERSTRPYLGIELLY